MSGCSEHVGPQVDDWHTRHQQPALGQGILPEPTADLFAHVGNAHNSSIAQIVICSLGHGTTAWFHGTTGKHTETTEQEEIGSRDHRKEEKKWHTA